MKKAAMGPVAKVVGVAASVMGLALGSVVLSGCSLSLSAQDRTTNNSCSSDNECGPNGTCIASGGQDKVCAATKADLGQVILEVRPASDVKGKTVSNIFTDQLTVSGAFPGGATQTVDLRIPQLVTFSGSLLAPKVDAMCTGTDGSLPLHVELRTVSPFENLSPTYKGDATLADGKYVYSLQVPAGVYDIYLAPDVAPDCSAASLPPRLLSGQTITSNTELKQDTTAPVALQGSIIVPDNTDVSGWTVEVVDPDYGLVISDGGSLSPPVAGISQIQSGTATSKLPGIRYFYKKSAVIRLRDTAGKLMVHWSLDLLDPTMVKLNLADLVANTQSVEASVVDANTQPVVATVRIQSLMLTGNANQNASFRVDTETDAFGKIHADLVEGTYRVSVSPKNADGPSATLVEDWVLKGTLGYGRAFVLPPRPTLSGTLSAPNGSSPLPDVSVLATPVVDNPSYVTSVFSPAESLLRQSLGQTDAAGRLQMLVDPGTLDIAVQPSAESGFPWLVVPRLLVGSATQKPEVSLGAIRMPAPAIVSGKLSSMQGVVPSAVIRAWLPIPGDGKTAGKPVPLVQIGETVSDESGHFVLPLPPSISFSPPMP